MRSCRARLGAVDCRARSEDPEVSDAATRLSSPTQADRSPFLSAAWSAQATTSEQHSAVSSRDRSIVLLKPWKRVAVRPATWRRQQTTVH